MQIVKVATINNNDFKTISDPESGEIICEICGIVLSEEKKLPLHTRVYEEINANSHFNTTTNTNSQNHDNNSSNNKNHTTNHNRNTDTRKHE